MKSERNGEWMVKEDAPVLTLSNHRYTYSLDLLERARKFHQLTGTLPINPRIDSQALIHWDDAWMNDYSAYTWDKQFFKDMSTRPDGMK